MTNEPGQEPVQEPTKPSAPATPPGQYVAITEMDSTSVGLNMRQGLFTVPALGDDPTAETRGFGEGEMRTWLEGGQLQIGIFFSDVGWTRLSEERIDTIKMFCGAAADIGAGWQLCDGTNGTPDLVDKFVLGSGWDEVGEETEESSAVLDDHAAISTHSVTQPATHPATLTGDEDDTRFVASGAASEVANINHGHLTQALTHSATAVAAHSAISAHAFSSDYVPPSYKLAYIMKVS